MSGPGVPGDVGWGHQLEEWSELAEAMSPPPTAMTIRTGADLLGQTQGTC